MSGEGPPGDGGPGPAPDISIAAGETDDGQERWFSQAAYGLQISAACHSASCGRPGFIPDDYLRQLES